MSRVTEPIDDLVLNPGPRDASANDLIPNLERDELLIKLDQYAKALKQRAALSSSVAGGVALKR